MSNILAEFFFKNSKTDNHKIASSLYPVWLAATQLAMASVATCLCILGSQTKLDTSLGTTEEKTSTESDHSRIIQLQRCILRQDASLKELFSIKY